MTRHVGNTTHHIRSNDEVKTKTKTKKVSVNKNTYQTVIKEEKNERTLMF